MRQHIGQPKISQVGEFLKVFVLERPRLASPRATEEPNPGSLKLFGSGFTRSSAGDLNEQTQRGVSERSGVMSDARMGVTLILVVPVLRKHDV